MKTIVYALVFLLLVFSSPAVALADRAASWADEWPRTDFSKTSVALEEIDSSVARDSIPSIDAPRFVPIAEVLIEDGKSRRFSTRPYQKLDSGVFVMQSTKVFD